MTPGDVMLSHDNLDVVYLGEYNGLSGVIRLRDINLRLHDKFWLEYGAMWYEKHNLRPLRVFNKRLVLGSKDLASALISPKLWSRRTLVGTKIWEEFCKITTGRPRWLSHL